MDTGGLLGTRNPPEKPVLTKLNGRAPARYASRAHLSRVGQALGSLSDFDPVFLARLRARFDAKWTPEPTTGCHLWFGAANSGGYGCIGVGAYQHTKPKIRAAHRVAWLLEHGTVPEGLVLDHLCRNHACVNPRHLEPVTLAVNSKRGVDARREAA